MIRLVTTHDHLAQGLKNPTARSSAEGARASSFVIRWVPQRWRSSQARAELKLGPMVLARLCRQVLPVLTLGKTSQCLQLRLASRHLSQPLLPLKIDPLCHTSATSLTYLGQIEPKSLPNTIQRPQIMGPVACGIPSPFNPKPESKFGSTFCAFDMIKS